MSHSRSSYYEADSGQIFYFNDPVMAEFCLAPKEDRVGRLVQVRKKAGAFGSDLYFIRRNDGSLMTFENVGLRKYTGDVSEPFEGDSIGVEYTVKDEYPETGFVIDNPCGPHSKRQSFAVTISAT